MMLLSLPSDKNAEIDRQREQYEKLKWQLEGKLQELDGELALQRQVGGARALADCPAPCPRFGRRPLVTVWPLGDHS